ncbi:Peptide methionine sulfoxide reductase [gamma proteobacterium HTCC2207]|jgi:peptide-methionine (S)-S-oxide reductase|uniref:Peptide methionine sulfoxide reductase MsrA n=1 Tax=gamma proteobacterium HTCC2207 TaxID=314287 RepID=Q1YT87_9GAMM|nr:Peptide methionine sulfoxide reductase [gamma proteobacterium HTCC2207]MBT6114445.1 peptide-methionine (S)-S-oxide reductase MsrA [Porticoccaceae bacterium]MDC3261140.1 peptide-methionine (S)-S-oxide reductase MsrA [bacterium]MDB4427186.1 peptide-methionine (S)-S-oxide reductase MsrA [Porticoccaceae bacterium]MDC0590085.1 peptide-methionine (S)-S-oxide reductase MsrA [Porticoccaceae bacterium]
MFRLNLPTADQALPGRETAMQISNRNFINGQPLQPPFADGLSTLVFGMGCFWGAERRFWQQAGVVTTAVGYAGGATPNPTYEEACSGLTGHSEVVLVVFDPAQISFEQLLTVFWESHDPTQGMRQGNDQGSQYRSVIYCDTEAQLAQTMASAETVQGQLTALGFGEITTEIRMAPTFYYAEEYHQQYLAKNPGGYCGLRGTGISCAI